MTEPKNILISDISVLHYFYGDYCRSKVTVTTLKLRHFVARQDDATYYGILSPHKTPPLWGIEGLPHGNAPRSPTPPSHTLVPMGTDYDDDQEGIRFDDPTPGITVEDNGP